MPFYSRTRHAAVVCLGVDPCCAILAKLVGTLVRLCGTPHFASVSEVLVAFRTLPELSASTTCDMHFKALLAVERAVATCALRPGLRILACGKDLVVIPLVPAYLALV